MAIDLANTIMVLNDGEAVELLDNPEHLRGWLKRERDQLGDCTFALNHLSEIRTLRDAVRHLFLAAATGSRLPRPAAEAVNAASAAAPVAPQLAIAAQHARSGELPSSGDPLAQLLGKIARSAINVLTGPDAERLQVCTAPSCGMFYIGSRRWCCAACGNRARAARHYHRTRAA